jgi:hypothetical protein
MTIDSNYELTSSNDLDFNSDEPSSYIDNDIAEFELNVSSSEEESSKHQNKRNFLANKKIEQLQEECRFRKFDDENYDDWN